ncbi:hypothetical protein M409DRAFT_54512 [Zasmidium cellare ATCC 36951]|uniref:tyrosinase n=1 Tax=Zasmidium cellare ATCC 36951 TaxID=1080233 RepID=A0A6A6CLW1_ZASCE|nr:uncharacterized protein M409DRAFT_54512 [Zasmidium cellare ATCC 36951]KAF2166719.1 hypothetical protein M409DRAFT_54512 [Zasmidium cellare ATCC 36951]
MNFLTAVSTFALACSSVLAHPSGDIPTLEERQNGIVVTSGAGGSTVYPRLEVRQMKDTRPNQYALLVLAMQRWQSQSQSSQTSYFGISSIHGVPRQNYNGVGQCQSCGGTDGYCCHDSVHFPAWHRVYVALFEQEFLKLVKTIANEYPDSQKSTMVAAANQMRWPYWDWAAKPPAGRPHLPKIVTDYEVTVNGPKGTTTFRNPLFRYDFTDSSGMYYSPFTTWKRTYRYPSTNGVNADSQTQSATNAFNNVRQSLTDQIYQLFTNCHDYLHFSNDDAGSSSAGCSLSLESIHNTIHSTAGGTGQGSVSAGHMFYLPTAAFDPLFWLHHCNVDRLFAMWQTLNPDKYGAQQVAPHSTWTIAQGSTQGPSSPLTPFYKNTNGQFWTTNDVRDWANTFKYTYPEYSNSDGSKASITNYINGLYGPNGNKVAGSSKREAALLDNLNLDVLKDVPDALADALPSNPLAAANGTLFQYFANVQSPRYALGGSYQIFVFNGLPTSEDPMTWIFDKNLIGPIGVVAQEGMEDSKLITSNQIVLTRALQGLVDGGALSAMTEAIVAPFLTKNLQWRILGPKGNSIDPGTVEGFVVSIFASTASQPSSASVLPEFSEFIPLLDVTKGQSGGANQTLTQYISDLL